MRRRRERCFLVQARRDCVSAVFSCALPPRTREPDCWRRRSSWATACLTRTKPKPSASRPRPSWRRCGDHYRYSLHSGGRCRDGHLSRWLFYLSPLSIYRASSHVDLRRQRRTSRRARRPSSRLHCAGSVLAAANPAGMRHQQRGGEVVVESGMRRGIRARLHPWRRLCLRQGQRSTAPQH